MWKIPERTKKLLRKYYSVLTSNEQYPKMRLALLYDTLRPELDWAVDALAEVISYEAAESEIFLLLSELLDKWNKDRGSLIGYLGTQLPWKISAIIENRKKVQMQIPSGLTTHPEIHYEMPEEIYLSVPEFLYETRWLAKDLTRAQKHLIVQLLMSDNDITREEFADSIGVRRTTIFTRISELADILKEKGFIHG